MTYFQILEFNETFQPSYIFISFYWNTEYPIIKLTYFINKGNIVRSLSDGKKNEMIILSFQCQGTHFADHPNRT